MAQSEGKGSSKLWMWLGLGCGGSLLLLVLIVGGISYFASRLLNLSTDPESAASAAREIADYEIPGGERGLMALEIQGMQLAGVSSADDTGAVVLMLGKYPLQAENGEEFRRVFEERLESQQPAIAEQESRTEARSLCGVSANLTIVEGQQQGTEEAALVYQTVFSTSEFVYFVTLTTAGAEAEPVAERVFDSLECK